MKLGELMKKKTPGARPADGAFNGNTAGGDLPSDREFRKECRNPKCIHRNKNQNKTQLLQKYSYMTFFSCLRCSAHVADIINGRK